ILSSRSDLPASPGGVELGRALPAPDGSGNRDVSELSSLASAPEQQPTSAHVAATHELAREHEPLGEDVEQCVDVLTRRDAAEEHNAAVASEPRCDVARIAAQRSEVALVRCGDVHLAEPL